MLSLARMAAPYHVRQTHSAAAAPTPKNPAAGLPTDQRVNDVHLDALKPLHERPAIIIPDKELAKRIRKDNVASNESNYPLTIPQGGVE